MELISERGMRLNHKERLMHIALSSTAMDNGMKNSMAEQMQMRPANRMKAGRGYPFFKIHMAPAAKASRTSKEIIVE